MTCAAVPNMTYHDAMNRAERSILGAALTRTRGQVRAAARDLKISERTLWHRLERLGMDRRNYCVAPVTS